ncbi:phosphoribosylglycinamide formyltransferase [Entomomonas asaccharolytica]|uniref:Phosphoribosylglycinamide formyltransferase n=1 Tax=Entomomonas asaccharolytica TaxID=2785331 RepID=A0A974NFH1_9GAMM|nr:phosphoribosylglycinamide formyltransferase [Entomomonas asaccharolytica]QQP85811.1 phosphoribosylglycinamide formyltransferase [Entomomonas asaccharolytica]
MNKPCKIVVLISGNGSNLQAIIDSIHTQHCPAEIVAVISNKAEAYGLVRAQQAGITAHCIDHRQYQDRQSFDQALMKLIDQYQPDLVVLAGFMRILTDDFVNHYLGHLINIHPSLLPKYPGLNTHQRALLAGDKQHGCSVHFVTPVLDGGPVIIQGVTAITDNIDLKQLEERVHQLEHKIYPIAITWFAEQRLVLVNNAAMLDAQPLPLTGYYYESND